MAPSNTPHRSRKRLKGSTGSASLRENAVFIDPKTNNQSPAFPLASFFWPIRKSTTSQWVIIPLVLMIVGLFRWSAGLWGYSGEICSKPGTYRLTRLQDTRLRPCMVTTKPRDTGWRLQHISQPRSGTSMIYNIGGWTILP